MGKRIAKWGGAALLLVLALAVLIVPAEVERRSNRTLSAPPHTLSEPARALHQRLTIADLHADSLLWGRDLLARGTRCHVDLPRLAEGNVAVQAFTVVTKVPRGLNIERNEANSDLITLSAMVQRWPPRTWTSLRERALYQAELLHRLAQDSGGRFVILESRDDLRAFLDRRAREPRIVACFLGLEGAHALEGRLENVDALCDAGFRMIGLTHFFDNEFAGSTHGVGKGGLTPLGRELVRRLEEKRILIDLAHASPQTIQDVLAMATRPVVVSHTGVKGTCDNRRNLSDEQLRSIARTGGVIGIGFWPTAVCGEDARAIARAIRYAANLVGVEHVALGSDFDGAVTAHFDAAGLAQLTEALLAEGFTPEETAKVMGGNVVRLLSEQLP